MAMAPNGGIGVDPNTVRTVSQQCRQVQTNLETQVQSLNQQLSELSNSLMGPSADAFKSQFGHWQNIVRQMSDTLSTTSTTLNQIADSADAVIAALHRLAGQ